MGHIVRVFFPLLFFRLSDNIDVVMMGCHIGQNVCMKRNVKYHIQQLVSAAFLQSASQTKERGSKSSMDVCIRELQ